MTGIGLTARTTIGIRDQGRDGAYVTAAVCALGDDQVGARFRGARGLIHACGHVHHSGAHRVGALEDGREVLVWPCPGCGEDCGVLGQNPIDRLVVGEEQQQVEPERTGGGGSDLRYLGSQLIGRVAGHPEHTQASGIRDRADHAWHGCPAAHSAEHDRVLETKQLGQSSVQAHPPVLLISAR